MTSDSPVPAHQVKINGLPLSDDATADLLDVTVYQDVTAPAMFALRLVNWDLEKTQLKWSDDKTFDIGSEVEVSLGYVDALEPLMVGEITGIEPEFEASSVFTVTIRGHDRSHRLLRGRHTRTFTQMKDSDIVKKVAGDAGLSVKAVDTRIKLEYVLQHNQTDLEFLQERARRNGYELVVDKKQLEFRPPPLTSQPAVELDLSSGLIEFRPRLTTMAQVSKIEVRGWDPKAKKEIVGKAAASKVTAKMAGATTGPQAVSKAFGDALGGSVDLPVASPSEANELAGSLIGQTALTYVVGDGVTAGNTKLRAGSTIDIDGVGKRFSGTYYVVAATHSYRPRYGYRTAFNVRRTAT